MFIEVRKAAFANKGAELMLYSVLQRMSKEYPHAKFVMEPNRQIAPFEKRAKLGLYQKIMPGRYGTLPLSSFISEIIPDIFKSTYGLVTDQELDVVLDASGFSYSDQFIGQHSTQILAKLSKKWKNQKTKLILLPQAFGPFKTQQTKEAIKIIVDNSDLIFAREDMSYHYLTEIVGKRENIKIAPDFTNLIEGLVPKYFDRQSHKFCIVPNYRMIEKTSPQKKSHYITFLEKCAKYLLDKDCNPFILVHETENDIEIARYLSTALNGYLPIVEEESALNIKGILGCCEATVGSRFHGLVSALSQGVPSLGTSWSHKYEKLFQEYDFEEGLVDFSENSYENILEALTQSHRRQEIAQKLREKSQDLKLKSEEMWRMVFNVINSAS
jgi:colanic acid/amylovoran biosynthesis protein